MTELWLEVTSDTAAFKAMRFLKLVKPPFGEELTDQNIKLDWNKETTDKWTVNEAKTSMADDGYDWEKRDSGQPLGEDNFRVIYEGSGDPVVDFELVEEWMGPAMTESDPWVYRDGVGIAVWEPGSLYDKFPPAPTFNTLKWVNVTSGPLLDASEFWLRTTIQKIKDTAASSNKVSKNGNGDSVWYEWTNVQDPDLGGDTIRLFEENANGDPFPLQSRMVWAV